MASVKTEKALKIFIRLHAVLLILRGPNSSYGLCGSRVYNI